MSPKNPSSSGRQLAQVDMWIDTIQLYLAEQHKDVPLNVLYNMARLLEQRERTGADEIWQKLAQKVAELPAPIRRIVCEKN